MFALYFNSTGFDNTAIGCNSDVSSGNLNNATVIGASAVVNTSNKVRIGNTSVSVIEGNSSYTVSDGRFKKNIQDNVVGLNFIMALKPVTYNFEYQKFSSFLGEKNADAEWLKQKESKTEIGFIAQDIEATCKKLGINASNIVHTPVNDKDNYSIAYQELVVPLVKGMQEQQALIKAMNEKMDAMQKELDKLKSQK